MTDIDNRVRHENILRAEISEVLHIFSKATSADDIAFSVARSVCNLTRARSVVYVAALNGTEDSSPLTIGTYGSSSMFMDYEYWRASAEKGMNFGDFTSVAKARGWVDLDAEYIFENPEKISEGSKLYCRKISDVFGIFTGYLCIESSFNPFEFAGFDGALLVLSIGSLRFFQAQGQYGAQSVILHKIIHDLNGSLAVIGLQSELLQLKSNIDNHFLDAKERIQSALKKADLSVRGLNEFSHLFYPDGLEAEGYKSSSLPGVALSAAISSLRLTPEQLSKLHINSVVPDFQRVAVEGIVLYWIYRAMLNAWANHYLKAEFGPVDVFIDLKKTDSDTEYVQLVISRKVGHPVDEFIDGTYSLPFGDVNGGVMLMPPMVIMEKTASLYGGISSLETLDNVRIITIGFPVFQQ